MLNQDLWHSSFRAEPLTVRAKTAMMLIKLCHAVDQLISPGKVGLCERSQARA